MDIGIKDSKIAAIEKDIPLADNTKVIDAKDLFVTPGLIDGHTHVYPDVIWWNISPDAVGVRSGVTCIVDAGSAGCDNFEGFKNSAYSLPQTSVFSLLNIASGGLDNLPSEINDWDDIDYEKTIATVEANRNAIRGIKLRLACSLTRKEGVKVLQIAKKAARESGLPLMVHFGDQDLDPNDDLSRRVLPLLDEGDILSHPYTSHPGRVIDDTGNPLTELYDAVKRGIILDVARGGFNISFDMARAGLEKGLLPSMITTDISLFSYHGPVYNLTSVMSTFLELGLSLQEIIRMTTLNPAKIFNIDDTFGSLKVGRSADISLLKIADGNWTFVDYGKQPLTVQKAIVPVSTLKNGQEIEVPPFT